MPLLRCQHPIELPADTRDGKTLLDVAAGLSPKIAPQVESVDESLERLGERAGILRRNDETAGVTGISEDIPHRRNVARYDREAASHRLQRRYRETFRSRRQHIDIRSGEVTPYHRSIELILFYPLNAGRPQAFKPFSEDRIVTARPDQ